MMELWGLIPFFVFVVLSVSFMVVWVYKDAKSRNMKAGLWTLLSMSGNNCSGLFLYLIFRRKNAKIDFNKSHKKYVVCFAISMTGVLLSFFFVVYQMITKGVF